MAEEGELPLFPLRTVLFPDGVLPLRIFEPRYLSMVGRCLREGGGFGVVLSRREGEAGFYPFGTVAEISDWDQGEDGLLQITARGTRRFKVLATRSEPDGLLIGELRYRDTGWGRALGDGEEGLAELAAQLLTQLPQELAPMPERLDDAAWVSFRLSELLPLVPAQRQALLQIDEVDDRIQVLQQAIALITREDPA